MAKETKMETSSRKETRLMQPEDAEFRIDDNDDEVRISGFAAKFGKWSENLGGFREKIRKGAFTEAIKESDVRALKNHDSNLLLGRTKSGTLRLEETSTGLRFVCDVPDTVTGRDTVTEIKRGDLSGCSFAFTVEEDDWKYKEDNDLVERIIIKVGRLYDVGPVTYPAYPDTTVAARSLEEFRETLPKEPKEEEGAEEEIEEVEETEEVEEKVEENQLDFETQHAIDAGYRKAGRIIQRCSKSED